MLYTLISDHHHYRDSHFDRDQVWRILEECGDDHIDNRIDVNGAPRSFKDIVKEPLIFSFPVIEKADKKKAIPDINIVSGRLLLNTNAYDVLKPLIENDGEFMPATYEGADCYFFIPMRVANIDPATTRKDEWDEIISLGFIENQVKNWSLFRTEYNGYMRLYCQQSIKDAIEDTNLTGTYITPDLANIFPEERGDVTDLNS